MCTLFRCIILDCLPLVSWTTAVRGSTCAEDERGRGGEGELQQSCDGQHGGVLVFFLCLIGRELRDGSQGFESPREEPKAVINNPQRRAGMSSLEAFLRFYPPLRLASYPSYTRQPYDYTRTSDSVSIVI